MKKYRIELKEEYFKDHDLVDDSNEMMWITGLVFNVFSSDDLQFVKKFLDKLYVEYPDLKGYAKAVEEDER